MMNLFQVKAPALGALPKKVETEAQSVKVQEVIKTLRKFLKEVEKERKDITIPIDNQKKAILEIEKKYTEKARIAVQELAAMLNKFLAEQRQRAIEAEKQMAMQLSATEEIEVHIPQATGQRITTDIEITANIDWNKVIWQFIELYPDNEIPKKIIKGLMKEGFVFEGVNEVEKVTYNGR